MVRESLTRATVPEANTIRDLNQMYMDYIQHFTTCSSDVEIAMRIAQVDNFEVKSAEVTAPNEQDESHTEPWKIVLDKIQSMSRIRKMHEWMQKTTTDLFTKYAPYIVSEVRDEIAKYLLKTMTTIVESLGQFRLNDKVRLNDPTQFKGRTLEAIMRKASCFCLDPASEFTAEQILVKYLDMRMDITKWMIGSLIGGINGDIVGPWIALREDQKPK